MIEWYIQEHPHLWTSWWMKAVIHSEYTVRAKPLTIIQLNLHSHLQRRVAYNTIIDFVKCQSLRMNTIWRLILSEMSADENRTEYRIPLQMFAVRHVIIWNVDILLGCRLFITPFIHFYQHSTVTKQTGATKKNWTINTKTGEYFSFI